MKDQTAYRRVPGGTGRGRYLGLERSSLWMAADHLLLVELRGWSERYHRFYFRDIQAFVLRDSSERLIKNILFGLAVAGCLGMARAVDMTGWLLTWLLFACIFSVAVVLNSASGRGCQTRIKTRVQSRVLPSLHRWPKALKVLEQIRRQVDDAQADLPRPALEAADMGQVEDLGQAASLPAKTDERPEAQRPHPAHWFLLAAGVLFATDVYLELSLRKFALVALSIVVDIALIGSLIWVAVVHRKTRYPTRFKVFAWAHFTTAVVLLVAAFFQMIYLAAGTGVSDEMGLARLMYTVDLDTVPWLRNFMLIELMVYGTLTVAGASILLSSKPESQA